MRFLIQRDDSGGTIFLVQEPGLHPFLPTAEVNTAHLRGTFGPAAVIVGKDQTLRTVAQAVVEWATRPERTQEEREAAKRFLEQWPQGPQLTG